MPVRTKPFTQACPQCNWSKTSAPVSDVLIAGRDIATQCPRCGAKALKIHEASAFAVLISRVKRLLA